MSILVNEIKCPSCGANLKIEAGRDKVYCTYCGTPIVITNENEYIYRHIDEAEIKKAEVEKLVELKKLELLERKQEEKSKRKRFRIIISVILGTIGLLFCGIGAISGIDGLFAPGLLSIMILAYMWLLAQNEYYEDGDDDTSLGKGVHLPTGIVDYKNKNFNLIETHFHSAGFYDVQCIPLRDLTTGILQRPNHVESITINGENVNKFNFKSKIPTDSKIVITYHSF